jgi:hypothetical protein
MPLLVLVGGTPCQLPTLYDEKGKEACANNSTQCMVYGSRIQCYMQPMLGYRLPVLVFSNNRNRLRMPTAAHRPRCHLLGQLCC